MSKTTTPTDPVPLPEITIRAIVLGIVLSLVVAFTMFTRPQKIDSSQRII